MRDEQRETERFERLCGGVANAQALLRIWGDSYPQQGAYIFERYSKEDVFRRKATAAGFSQRQVNAFLALQ